MSGHRCDIGRSDRHVRICINTYILIYIYIYLSIYLYFYLSISLSLSLYLSIYLSTYLFTLYIPVQDYFGIAFQEPPAYVHVSPDLGTLTGAENGVGREWRHCHKGSSGTCWRDPLPLSNSKYRRLALPKEKSSFSRYGRSCPE